VMISREDLGDFDALVLGLLLMSHAEGQVVVPGSASMADFHSRLIREERLIVGSTIWMSSQSLSARAFS
jgi:hypothetical protein